MQTILASSVNGLLAMYYFKLSFKFGFFNEPQLDGLSDNRFCISFWEYLRSQGNAKLIPIDQRYLLHAQVLCQDLYTHPRPATEMELEAIRVLYIEFLKVLSIIGMFIHYNKGLRLYLEYPKIFHTLDIAPSCPMQLVKCQDTDRTILLAKDVRYIERGDQKFCKSLMLKDGLNFDTFNQDIDLAYLGFLQTCWETAQYLKEMT